MTTPLDDLNSPLHHGLETAPPLLAIIMSWWLFGVLFMQYLLYLNHAGTKRDGKVIRGIVHLIFLLDTVQSILIVNDAFRWFVFGFGNYEPLGRSGLTGVDGPILDCIIAMIVQFFYCWRIWVLGKRMVFPIVVAFLAVTSAVSGIVGGVYEVAHNFVISTKVHQWYIPGMIWMWTSVATDVLIAAIMIYLLRFKSRNCGEGLRVVVRRLLILTLETNTLTAMFFLMTAIIGFFPSVGPPFTNLHRLAGYNIGKLYSNCFMVLLNQRIYYERSSQIETFTTELGTLECAQSSSGLHWGSSTIQDTTGEVSIIQFPEAASQVGSKSGRNNDDLELGGSRRGLRILVDTAGSAGEK